MKTIVGFLVWLVLRLYVFVTRKPSVTFYTPDGKPYLTRWPLATAGKWPDEAGRTAGSGWYLHRIVESDYERALHNHPAPGFALVLRGGYHEERYEYNRHDTPDARAADTYRHRLHPCDANLLTSHTFHRIDLPHTYEYDDAWTPIPSWSLFYFGARTGIGWGFLQADGTVSRAAHNDGHTGEKTARPEPVVL